MKLRVIRYFIAIANEKSVSGAAKTLHITQPTLSRQIKDLEDELGVTLFIRGNRQISLTDEGKLFKKRSEEILSLIDKTESELHSPSASITGDLYIGGAETEAMSIIASVLNDMHDDYPNLHFHIYSGNGDDVTEKLENGLLDFGVLIAPFDLSKYEHLPLPAKDTWGLLMKKEHPLASRNTISAIDLKALPLMISRQSLIQNVFSDWLHYDFEQLNIVSTYNLIYNASLLVKEGLACALSLDKLTFTGKGSPFVFCPLEPSLYANISLVWKKNQIFSKASQEFLKRMHFIANKQ